MTIFNNSDTIIPVLAQQELERGLANIGYEGSCVTANRVKVYDESEHYGIYGDNDEFLFFLDADAFNPVIY